MSTGSEILRETDLRFHHSAIEKAKRQVFKSRVWAGTLLTAAAVEGAAVGWTVNETISDDRLSQHGVGMTGVAALVFLGLSAAGGWKLLEASWANDEVAGSRDVVSRLEKGEFLYHTGGGAD
ncbi:hypothetical protein HY380_00050 [Candidatus Saccharibacteria bacterium]|nr:hypothetical protein [Candidatus Saccharibacteria bacterium]